MPIELEAKIKVASHADVRARLAVCGAPRLGAVLESNAIFDNEERTLLSGGCGLRIRVCRAERGEPPRPTLTFKGPRQPGELKRREEIEITFDDAEAGTALLERLGFVAVVRFEKRRESWQLGDCRVELDEVPLLGHYVEIEGPDEQAILQARQDLGLAGSEMVRESYVRLLVEYCRAHDLPADRITFATRPHGNAE